VTRPAGTGGASLAEAYQLIIFDLDGVVYLGTEPVSGAVPAIDAIVDGGTPVAFVTNNASRRASEVGVLLRGMGLKARDDDVLTSAQAAAELLKSDLPAGSPVLVVGAPALAAEVQAAGLIPVDRAGARPVAVVQGYGPDVGWAVLAEACVAIRAGARWVATNTDVTLPSPRGPLPGNGSLIAALATALGRGPDVVVGKPEPTLFRLVARHREAGRVLVVGDRLDTDIEGANRAALDSMLVLTGVSTPTDLIAAPAARRPTFVAAGLRALSTSDTLVRVPAWDKDQAVAGGWRVTDRDDRLELTGDGDTVAALLALAAAAWARPEWTAIIPDGDPASRAVTELGLGKFSGWPVAG
jgi:HAD superfamily hydrolase (TIGR01450 family)